MHSSARWSRKPGSPPERRAFVMMEVAQHAFTCLRDVAHDSCPFSRYQLVTYSMANVADKRVSITMSIEGASAQEEPESVMLL